MTLSKRDWLILLCVGLLALPACHGVEKPQQVKRDIVIQVNAPKLAVFDAISVVVMKYGFSIITSNERIGLVTTDYKDMERDLAGSLLMDHPPQIQLTTNVISTSDQASVLTILPKGRRLHKKVYEEYFFNDEFLDAMRKNIGREIKEMAEAKK